MIFDGAEHIEDTNDDANFELADLYGSFELIIAGECADFSFTLDKMFCDQYGIEIE